MTSSDLDKRSVKMNQPIISIRNVSKKYRLGKLNMMSLRDELQAWIENLRGRGLPKAKNPADFLALNNVSLDIEQGQVLGLIGRNGAGKSTLLKILSRITEPSSGEIHLFGRLASLLEVGTGFHPELSGRENVYLNGAILGMSKAEIGRKFDEIVDFSEIGQFLDTPVKRYSSGMYVRLAFAIAAHLEPEILIVDEVLAVGDAEFQRKCIDKMEAMRRTEGRTIIFVSHSAEVVSRLCTHCVLLEKGEVKAVGKTRDVMALYHGHRAPVQGPGIWIRLSGLARAGTQMASFQRVRYRCIDDAAPVDGPIHPMSRVGFDIEITAAEALTAHSLAVTIYGNDGMKLMNFDTVSKGILVRLRPGSNHFEIRTDCLPLNTGTYSVGFWLEPHRGAPPADWIESAFQMEITPAPGESGWNKPFCDGHVVSSFDILNGEGQAASLSMA